MLLLAALTRWLLLGAACVVGPGCSAPPATRSAAPPAAPAAACSSDLRLPEGLACAVFETLRRNDEARYVDLHVHAADDVAAMASLLDHPRRVPTDEEVRLRRARIAEAFRTFQAALRSRGIDPERMDLVGVLTDGAMMRSDIGFAEDITVIVRDRATELRITIDDCVFVRGRWLIEDGLKLRS